MSGDDSMGSVEHLVRAEEIALALSQRSQSPSETDWQELVYEAAEHLRAGGLPHVADAFCMGHCLWPAPQTADADPAGAGDGRVNKDLAAKIKNQVENVTHVPEGLPDLGLSLSAVGLYIRWLHHYQHGDVYSLAQAVGYVEANRDPAVRAAIVEIREAGILPSLYELKARDDAAFLAGVAP
jgi:hypothetical protein